MTTIFQPATWSPTDKGSAVTLSNGNLTIASTHQTDGGVRSTRYVESGKWYYEIVATGRTPLIGVGTSDASLGNYPGADVYGWGYGGGGANAYYYHSGAGGSDTEALAVGDYIGVAVNMDALTVDFYINGVLAYGFTGLDSRVYAYAGGDTNGAWSDCVANFGASAFTYAPPSGYYAGFGEIFTLIEGSLEPTLPSLELFAENAGPTLINVPSLQFSAFSGVNSAPSLPFLDIGISAGTNANMGLPALTAYAAAHVSTGEQAAEVTLPSLTVDITTGAVGAAALPVLLLSAAGDTTIWGHGAATLPKIASASTGTVAATASADMSLPTLSSVAFSGAVCSVTIDNKIVMVASDTTGGVASMQATLPLFDATIDASVGAPAAADISLPMMFLGNTARAAVSLPAFTLTAIGHAVVSATYEAYAVNLKHQPKPGKDPIDEVTRYTNFPFTHIVRYQNSYFGANSTGLYLLEGTTDYASPTPTAIPWAFKTAMTDFKSPQHKTVASAYFGGRLGAAATVDLHVGEDGPQTYSYATVRTDHAQNYRQVFGKGTKARYYALGASGTGTLELDDIDLDVHTLARRI